MDFQWKPFKLQGWGIATEHGFLWKTIKNPRVGYWYRAWKTHKHKKIMRFFQRFSLEIHAPQQYPTLGFWRVFIANPCSPPIPHPWIFKGFHWKSMLCGNTPPLDFEGFSLQIHAPHQYPTLGFSRVFIGSPCSVAIPLLVFSEFSRFSEFSDFSDFLDFSDFSGYSKISSSGVLRRRVAV